MHMCATTVVHAHVTDVVWLHHAQLLDRGTHPGALLLKADDEEAFPGAAQASRCSLSTVTITQGQLHQGTCSPQQPGGVTIHTICDMFLQWLNASLHQLWFAAPNYCPRDW